jgi:opine dehydrogenase
MEVAILGAGNGGQASAAHLTLEGHRVRLYDRFPEVTAPFSQSRRLVIKGELSGAAVIAEITNNMASTLSGADIILVTVPGFALGWIAEAMAPYLADGQVVVLHPGGTGGALEVRHVWERMTMSADVGLAETETLVYACRTGSPGEPDVKAVKRRVGLAALPSGELGRAMTAFSHLYPQATSSSSVLATGLSNMNAVIHPVVALLNAGLIENRASGFDFYRDGVTAGIGRVLESIDRERVSLASAFGVPYVSYVDWVKEHYQVTAPGPVELFKALAATVYQGIGTPESLDARYVSEDVPMGLVPMECLATLAGVPTPTISAVISVSSTINGTDYRATGRTLERLGLAGLSVPAVLDLVGEEAGLVNA